MRLRPRTGTASFGQLTARWLLGFGVMYAFYTWYAFEGLTGESSMAERIVMVLGPLPVALSLLISPALFAAATETRHGSWSSLLLFSLAAYLLSAVGPTVTVSLTPTVPDQLSEPMFVSAPELELGRLLLPFTIAVFTPLVGVAGACVGHVTRWWRPGKQEAARRFACLALMASFWIPLWISVTLILNHGFPAAWILASLVLPVSLAGCTIAWRKSVNPEIGLFPWGTPAPSSSLDPQTLDRIVSAVAKAQDPGPLEVDARSRTELATEMARLVVGIRRIVAPRAKATESQVREIVAALASQSRAAATRPARFWRARVGSGKLSGFCAEWTCLAGGFLFSSPLAGVPPSPRSAVAVAFLASFASMVAIRRYAALPRPARI